MRLKSVVFWTIGMLFIIGGLTGCSQTATEAPIPTLASATVTNTPMPTNTPTVEPTPTMTSTPDPDADKKALVLEGISRYIFAGKPEQYDAWIESICEISSDAGCTYAKEIYGASLKQALSTKAPTLTAIAASASATAEPESAENEAFDPTKNFKTYKFAEFIGDEQVWELVTGTEVFGSQYGSLVKVGDEWKFGRLIFPEEIKAFYPFFETVDFSSRSIPEGFTDYATPEESTEAAKQAALNGMVASYTIDYQAGKDKWLENICAVSSVTGCKYARESWAPNSWPEIEARKVQQTQQYLQSILLVDIFVEYGNAQIWLCVDSNANFMPAFVTRVNGGPWEFERSLPSNTVDSLMTFSQTLGSDPE